MKYQVSWGRDVGNAVVTNVEELDAVLDTIGPVDSDVAYSVAIIAEAPSDDPCPSTLDIGIGHPHRSFAYYVGAAEDSAWGFQPELAPTADVYADYAGVVTEVWPERTRVSPDVARQAAREFVSACTQRPSCLSWDIDDE